ncbi:Axonemal dynein light chain domain-containing protein 1 [Tritrichomonas musculus]|uniref:Axonemal dynein light chain domain-containing protein 1 n=1 Tax=Tritrichomonas musculus TaxID=1915356 RepID=A0ABR2L9G3_9EUKA
MTLRSTAGIRRTLRSLPRTPTQPETGTIRLEELEEESKIPTKYHIVQQFPIVPHEYSSKGYKMYYENGVWNVVLWPSNTSNYKDEIRYLRSAVDKMMDDIETTPVDESEDIKGLQVVMKKSELLEMALRELNRQISREHSERGELMTYILDLYTNIFNELPNLYNNTFAEIQKDYNDIKKKMKDSEEQIKEREERADEEVRSLKILLDMQQQWHSDIESQIDGWQKSVKSFNDKLKSELKLQKEQYEDQINDLQQQLDSSNAERDAYKSQIDWEQKSLSEKEAEVIDMQKKLEQTKKLLDEREQTLYSTRTHFERQFTFLKEQMGQMVSKSLGDTDVDSLNVITKYLPPRQGEQLPFLPLDKLNQTISDIYLTRTRHDGAYSAGNEPPLSKYILKYFISKMFDYETAVPIIWQFLLSCTRYRHESTYVGLFMLQIEEQSNALQLIEYMVQLVQKEKIGENGLPRLSILKYANIASRVLPSEQIDDLKRLLERKIINPQAGQFLDFDIFLQIFLDLVTDRNHSNRQLILSKFNERLEQGKCDWPMFFDFVTKLAPYLSFQEVQDLFLDAIHSSLPNNTSVTPAALQLIIDNGTFERLQRNLSDDLLVGNPEETAAFVNMRWVSDVVSPVSKVINELRNEKSAECHKFFTQLTQIQEHMKTPCSVDDAGTGLSLLHLAGLLLVRYKFIKTARKDSIEAQKAVRQILDLVWT